MSTDELHSDATHCGVGKTYDAMAVDAGLAVIMTALAMGVRAIAAEWIDADEPVGHTVADVRRTLLIREGVRLRRSSLASAHSEEHRDTPTLVALRRDTPLREVVALSQSPAQSPTVIVCWDARILARTDVQAIDAANGVLGIARGMAAAYSQSQETAQPVILVLRGRHADARGVLPLPLADWLASTPHETLTAHDGDSTRTVVTTAVHADAVAAALANNWPSVAERPRLVVVRSPSALSDNFVRSAFASTRRVLLLDDAGGIPPGYVRLTLANAGLAPVIRRVQSPAGTGATEFSQILNEWHAATAGATRSTHRTPAHRSGTANTLHPVMEAALTLTQAVIGIPTATVDADCAWSFASGAQLVIASADQLSAASYATLAGTAGNRVVACVAAGDSLERIAASAADVDAQLVVVPIASVRLFARYIAQAVRDAKGVEQWIVAVPTAAQARPNTLVGFEPEARAGDTAALSACAPGDATASEISDAAAELTFGQYELVVAPIARRKVWRRGGAA